MRQHPVRVYAETSVFGGVFDEEFCADSQEFFDEVASGKYRLVVSAPERVRHIFERFARGAENVTVSDEARLLRGAYIHVMGYGEIAIHSPQEVIEHETGTDEESL